MIGINSQIYSLTGGFQGLSFAIPIDAASRVQAQLVEHGKVVRGRFGVSIQELDQTLARAFGLETPRGALVTGVELGSPAAAAGIHPGDRILSVNGTPAATLAQLRDRVKAAGDEVALLIQRDDARVFVPLRLG